MTPPLPSKPDPTLSDAEKQKQLDREIKDMVSALTNRLASLQQFQKAGGCSSRNDKYEDDEDDHGVRIITLAGSNVGATMRGDMDEKPGQEGLSMGEQEALSTYVNSNFQAINNSIMLGGEYSTNDPGVHLDISEYVEDQDQTEQGKIGEKKEKGSSSKSTQRGERMRLTP